MEFPAVMEYLPQVMEYLRSQTLKLGIEEKLVHKIELACEEAVVNIILYAYPEKKETLSITCEKRGKKFEVTLKDHGVPFNPFDVAVNPQTDVPMQDRKEGGLGIFLLRKTIDEANYSREGDYNVLRLIFNSLNHNS